MHKDNLKARLRKLICSMRKVKKKLRGKKMKIMRLMKTREMMVKVMRMMGKMKVEVKKISKAVMVKMMLRNLQLTRIPVLLVIIMLQLT